LLLGLAAAILAMTVFYQDSVIGKQRTELVKQLETMSGAQKDLGACHIELYEQMHK
jgi:hypothetical protein